jgi:6-phosphogluconolactonase
LFTIIEPNELADIKYEIPVNNFKIYTDTMKTRCSLFTVAVGIILISSCNTKQVKKEIIYVGTMSDSGNFGIFVYHFRRDSLKMDLIQSVNHLASPSFLTLNPEVKVLYSANRATINDSLDWGSISAFRIDPESGQLILMNDRPSYGDGPCHIEIDNEANALFISNYGSGSLVIMDLNADGSLGNRYRIYPDSGSSINTARQNEPHVHSSLFSADKSLLFVSDLGTDKIMIYNYLAKTLSLQSYWIPYISVDPGSGPRHMALNSSLPVLYSVQELSNMVNVISFSSENGPQIIQTISVLPSNYDSVSYSADIHIAPSGKYLYSSNRGHNSIAIFSIDPGKGMLNSVGHHWCGGNWPRNFMIDPDGKFLFVANQKSDNLVIFGLNDESGQIMDSVRSVSVHSPVCVKQVIL